MTFIDNVASSDTINKIHNFATFIKLYTLYLNVIFLYVVYRFFNKGEKNSYKFFSSLFL